MKFDDARFVDCGFAEAADGDIVCTVKSSLLLPCFLSVLVLTAPLASRGALQLQPIGALQVWKRSEFRILNVPVMTNPFDPDLIRLDATITGPSGRSSTIPGFYYQGYQRTLSGSSEQLSVLGAPEWRLRYAAPEPGNYAITINVATNGQAAVEPLSANFTVATVSPATPGGYVEIAPGNQNFRTSLGEPLRLNGANVCWHGSRGTFDYDDWFLSMQSAGENFARLWMCPWAFNLETDANALNRYRMDRAWQLDYVIRLAETRGIYILLCLDYHGMYESTPDYWGGNNMWSSNPYNSTNGGPCINQNAFFTNATAMATYQKRLRYLVARYGYSPNLLAWEFFNELDNVYKYLNPSDVAAWHRTMGRWFKTNDPFGHLVTTSMTGGSDRPEIWNLPEMDFSAYHSYGEPSPAANLSRVSQSFLSRYSKPVMIGEFGTDWRGWSRANDPYLRGFRQGIWGGALGGSVGTAMSWWWQNIHSENLYPVFDSLGKILHRTGWGRGTWTNISFARGSDAPIFVGDIVPGAIPFNAHLAPNGSWGGAFSGQLALADQFAAGRAGQVFNSFVHGSSHANMKTPFRISAWLTNNAQLVLHLNSVSTSPTLVVRVDGAEAYRTNLPNLDGGYSVNNEYNLDLPIPLPAGKRLIEITNTGVDWFYLDWVRVENVLPSAYPGGWQPSPDSIGLSGPREALVYVVSPYATFPANATNAVLPSQVNQSITLSNWPAGEFIAEWFQPATAAPLASTRSQTTNQQLVLALPAFQEDLAGIIYRRPSLRSLGFGPTGFAFQVDSETGGSYSVERTFDLLDWHFLKTITNTTGTAFLQDPEPSPDARAFYRLRR